jgi:hypothetical protein
MDGLKNEGGKRGLMFSFAALLLCICIVLFASVTAQWSLWDRQASSKLIDIDRTNDIYSNAEDGLVGISALSTNISSDGNLVRVFASLPAQDMSEYLRRFAQFESNFSDFNTTAETSGIGARRFYIMPSGMLVWHQNDRLTATFPSGGSGEPASYYVEAIFDSDGLDAAAWSQLSEDDAAGGLPVHVRVRNERYSVLYDFQESLNRSAASSLNITLSGLTVATISFFPQSGLEVYSPEGMDLKASIGFSTPVYIETNDTLSVVSIVNKTGRIRVGS